jgi:Protein of unknown function (DUF2934)
MDVTPDHGPTKRPRTKGAVKADTAKPARKTLTTSRKKSAPAAAVVAATPDIPLDLGSLIATEAFYLAAERSFVPGHELDDWLEAERRIRARYPA